jgi:LDH2 family malate/lactate/ureidoglycolate dehydrogenase
MPVFSASQLENLATAVFVATGAPADLAEQVSRSLVLANLSGHDSHGVIRIPAYVAMIGDGTTDPAARPDILSETPTTARVDGNRAFGAVTAHFVTRLAIAKARQSHVAAISAVRCSHIGRLGEYTEIAASEGVVAMLVTSAFDGGLVAPYGGVERVLTTNPISFGLPAGEDSPVVADIATSAIAEGKLQVARAKGQNVPPGCILDRDGNPSTNPLDFYDGGMILPFGGHKGYVLSAIVEMLSKHLAGAEMVSAQGLTFGLVMVAIDVSAFRPLDEMRTAVDATRDLIRQTKPAPGFQEVMSPGDPERRARLQRGRDGIDVPDDTVRALRETAERLGVVMPNPHP